MTARALGKSSKSPSGSSLGPSVPPCDLHIQDLRPRTGARWARDGCLHWGASPSARGAEALGIPADPVEGCLRHCPPPPPVPAAPLSPGRKGAVVTALSWGHFLARPD